MQNSIPNAVDNDKVGHILLHGNLSELIKLVDQGYDIHSSEEHVFRMATAIHRPDVIDYLLQKNVDINISNGHALHCAVINKSLEVVTKLLIAGAKVTDKAVQYSIKCNQPDILIKLIEYGASLEYAIDIAKDENTEVYQYILNYQEKEKLKEKLTNDLELNIASSINKQKI